MKYSILALFLIIITYSIVVVAGGYSWDYAMSTVLVKYCHKPDSFKLWYGLAISAFPPLGVLGMAGALVVFIIQFFI